MAKEAGVDCPNCGSPLFQGHEDVNGDSIAVCRNNDDPPLGCQAAWDLKQLSEDPVVPFGPWSVQQQPEVGSDIEPPEVVATPTELSKEELQATAPHDATLADEDHPA